MKRAIEDQLKQWCNNENSLPLFILGARQIGKTYSVLKFAKNFFPDKYVYINFFDKNQLYTRLEGKTNPKEIIDIINLELNIQIDETYLIIFDEIQEMKSIKISLKLFVEQGFKNKIICLGSYLGNYLNDKTSFPVGKIESIKMYPMGFEEFLYANKFEHLIPDIKESLRTWKPIDFNKHEKLLSLFYDYLIIGGMPEVLQRWIDTKDIALCHEMKLNLIEGYKRDIVKYTENNVDKIKGERIYENVPRFLSRKNNKFMLSNIDKNARYRDYDNSIYSLLTTRIIYKINNLNSFTAPIALQTKESEFKIYYNDSGFISAINRLDVSLLLKSPDYGTIRGSIAENFVLTELIKKIDHSSIAYYSFNDNNNNSYEVDFVVENQDGKPIPIEVKFGKDFSKISLNKLMSLCSNDTYSIIFSSKNINFNKQNRNFNIPLYALPFLNFENNRLYLKPETRD